jgi:hypothetical protein
MKLKKYKHSNSIVTIYHQEVITDYDNNITYLLITEIKEGHPQTTYYYKIPSNYQDGSLLGQLNEKYNPYCPN